MSWLFVLLPAILAGLVQGLTGFGSGIILMIFLPSLFPIAQSAGIATLMMALATFLMVYRYRKSIQIKRLILPFVVYASAASLSLHLGQQLDARLLKSLLGILLILLAAYFTFARSAATQRISFGVALLFMIISGFFNGLFGIGGPLMALYFLSLAKTKEEYLANLQLFFFIDMLYVTSLRIHADIIGIADIPYILLGTVGTISGSLLAGKLLQKMNIELVKKCIYVFIGLSGCYYLF